MNLNTNNNYVIYCSEGESRLDILVNNAGVFTADRRLTEDDLELDFGVNHIGESRYNWQMSDVLQIPK